MKFSSWNFSVFLWDAEHRWGEGGLYLGSVQRNFIPFPHIQTYTILTFTTQCSLYVISACILCRTVRILISSVLRAVHFRKKRKLFVLKSIWLQWDLETCTGVFYYLSSSFYVNPLSLLLAHTALRYALGTLHIPHSTLLSTARK
jgi:hypothetical protein